MSILQPFSSISPLSTFVNCSIHFTSLQIIHRFRWIKLIHCAFKTPCISIESQT
jgi:hypothetical protein